MLILYIRVLSVPLQSGPEIFYICQWRWASWNVPQEGKRSWLVTQWEISDSSPTLALPGLSIPGLPPRQLQGGTNFLFPLLHFQLLLTFLFAAYLFSFEGHSNRQGRSWVQQIRAQGTRITSFTRPSVPSASSAFLAGHCSLGAFSFLSRVWIQPLNTLLQCQSTLCSTGLYMAGADYKCSQLDVANPLSTILFIQALCPCALNSPFLFFWSAEGKWPFLVLSIWLQRGGKIF